MSAVTKLGAFFFNCGNCMQSFFLFIAHASIWNFGVEPRRVLNTLLELLSDCKHVLKNFVEVKISTFLGLGYDLQKNFDILTNSCST